MSTLIADYWWVPPAAFGVWAAYRIFFRRQACG
jgi:hypothetical protein